jgi:hypothetical protein
VISKDGEICIFPGPRLDANVWHLKLVGKLWGGLLPIGWLCLSLYIFPFHLKLFFTCLCFSFCSKICIFIKHLKLFFECQVINK